MSPRFYGFPASPLPVAAPSRTVPVRARNPSASAATITTWIKGSALPTVITGNAPGTPNLLLLSGGL